MDLASWGLGILGTRVIGTMEKKMETTLIGYIGIIGYILGLYIGV